MLSLKWICWFRSVRTRERKTEKCLLENCWLTRVGSRTLQELTSAANRSTKLLRCTLISACLISLRSVVRNCLVTLDLAGIWFFSIFRLARVVTIVISLSYFIWYLEESVHLLYGLIRKLHIVCLKTSFSHFFLRFSIFWLKFNYQGRYSKASFIPFRQMPE